MFLRRFPRFSGWGRDCAATKEYGSLFGKPLPKGKGLKASRRTRIETEAEYAALIAKIEHHLRVAEKWINADTFTCSCCREVAAFDGDIPQEYFDDWRTIIVVACSSDSPKTDSSLSRGQPVPQAPTQKPSESGLEQTIQTHQKHFGERWKEMFSATAKVQIYADMESNRLRLS